MNIFQYKKESPLTLDCDFSYDALAFDGCAYYFLDSCQQRIIKTNHCLQEKGCYQTCRPYDCFCYDYQEHCFWAAGEKFPNQIFKLNSCFKEIDCIHFCSSYDQNEGCCQPTVGIYHDYTKLCQGGGAGNALTGIYHDSINLCGNGKQCSAIKGISYNSCSDSLYLAFEDHIGEICKHSGSLLIKYAPCHMRIQGVFSLCPGYLLWGMRDNEQVILIVSQDNATIKSQEISCDYTLKSMVFNPCKDQDKSQCQDLNKAQELPFDCLLIKKDCYPYLVCLNLCPCDLGYLPCGCNYRICQPSCNDEACHKKDACADMLESIALVEAALSHILNAEGEKLQKVLATTDDLDKILCVNKEINQTIVHATHLEHALYDKLAILVDCCSCKDLCGQD
ncbi:MAG: hypothetical protein RR396_05480, partial [Clostridiales bacterium]